MSDDGIRVVVEDGDGAGSSGGSSFSDLKRRAESAEAELGRERQRSAHQHAITAAHGRLEAEFATADGEARAAELKYSAAMESGDFASAATHSREMAAAESKRLRVYEQAEGLRHTPVSSGDAFEDHLTKFTGPTAQWMREHKDWVTDPRKSSKLQGAHHMAVGDGLTPDTAEYFEYVEKTIGLNGGGGSRRAGSDIDPSDVRTHIANGGKQVFLTKGECDRANDGSIVWNHGPNKGKPIGNSEYARRKAELHRQGAYSKLD